MRTILVDPSSQSIEYRELDPTRFFASVRETIGAEQLAVVAIGSYFGQAGVEQLLIDEEALLRSPSPQDFTMVHRQPIAGRFLITRESPDMIESDQRETDGESGRLRRTHLLDVDFNLETVRDRLRFITPAYARAALDLTARRAIGGCTECLTIIAQPGSGKAQNLIEPGTSLCERAHGHEKR